MRVLLCVCLIVPMSFALVQSSQRPVPVGVSRSQIKRCHEADAFRTGLVTNPHDLCG